MAKEAIAAATEGLGDGTETSGCGNLHIPALGESNWSKCNKQK